MINLSKKILNIIESVNSHRLLALVFLFLSFIDIMNAMLFFNYELTGLSGIMFGLFLSISLTQATLFAMYTFNEGRAGLWLRLMLIVSNISVGWFATHLFWYARHEVLDLISSPIEWIALRIIT